MPEQINNLVGSNTFNDLLNTVNDTIDRLNEIDISTASEGDGISIDQNTNGDAQFSINLCTTSALSIGTDNCLTVDLTSLTERTTVQANDLFLIQTLTGLRSVKSQNMLPEIINGNHIFYNSQANSYASFETDYLLLNSNNVFVKDSYLYLNYDVNNLNNFEDNINIHSGLRIYAQDAGLLQFVYDGSISSWVSTKNLGFIGSEGKFLVKNNYSQAEFVFGLLTSQTSNAIKIQKSLNSFWQLTTDPVQNSLNFGTTPDTDTDLEDSTIFKIYNLLGRSVLHVMDKIYIGSIQDSSQFLTNNSFAQYKVPLSTTNGILDYKWTNRFVTQNVSGTVLVGDVVRISVDTDSYVITRADNTTELKSEAIGIVEKISSGKYYVVLTGEFNITGSLVSLVEGQTYYLSSSPGALTTTKPSTIVKPILIATGSKTGILLNSVQSQTPIYKNIYLVDEDVTLTPSEVNDTLAIKAGVGIAITQNSSNELEIYSSGGPGTQNTFASVNEISALHSNDNLSIVGENGITIETVQDAFLQIGQPFSTQVSIHAPNSFGVFEFTTDNTDQEQFTIESATSNSTFVFNAGVGIRFDRDTNDVVTITATGDAQPANRSVGNNQLSLMNTNSVKVGDSLGVPTDLEISDEGVIGRFRDDYNNLSNIIVLTPNDLRRMINATTEGLLEENQNAFSAIEIENNSIVNLIEATEKSDIIRFKAGTGILLQGEEQTDGDKIVTVSLNTSYLNSYVSGFTTVHLPDHSFTSGNTGAVLYFSETSTILPNSSNTTNTDVSFDIKPASITNYYLSDMPVNSIKGNNDNTDGSVTDIQINENNLFGRPSGGFIQSLTATQARTILGLTSSTYYKSASITYSGTTDTVSAINGFETLKFIAGTNVQLTRGSGLNEIVISAVGGTQEYGIKSIKLNNDTPVFPTSLIIKNKTIATSTTTSYTNISIQKTYDTVTNQYNLSFDLAGMPANSVKIATATGTGESLNSFIAGNLVIGLNSVLGRFGGNLVSIPMSLMGGFLGIKCFSKVYFDNNTTTSSSSSSSNVSSSSSNVSSSSSNVSSSSGNVSSSSGNVSSSSGNVSSSSGFSGLLSGLNGSTTAANTSGSFKLVGANGLLITGQNLDGIYGIPTFTFTPKISKLLDDTDPKLSADLNLNANHIKTNTGVYFKNTNTANTFFELAPESNNNTTLRIKNQIDTLELLVLKTEYSTQIGNLKLTPYGALSQVIINNGNLSSGNSELSLYTQSTINLNSSASTFKFNSTKNIIINTSTDKTISFKFGTSVNSDLIVSKSLGQTTIFSSNESDLVFGANMNGGASSKNIIMKANVVFDPSYAIFGNMNLNGEMLITKNFTSTSSYSKNTISTPFGVTSFVLDNIQTAQGTVVYNMMVSDSGAVNVKKLYTVKVLVTNSQDLQLSVMNDVSSLLGKTDTQINQLTFSVIYTNGTTNLVLSNIANGKQYTVSFTKVSFN